MAGKRDYYEVLSLAKTATKDEIEKAYRKLATRFHPDRNGGDEEAAARFREATEAAEVLLDPDKRQRYDRYGHAGLEGMGDGGGFGPSGSFQDLFSDLLGSFFGEAAAGCSDGDTVRYSGYKSGRKGAMAIHAAQ